jgi:imidazolonepropionase-like amidohydrolase
VIVLEVKKRYALINCNVISGKLDSVISRNNTILIEGSRIHKIGSSDEVKIPDGYSVIDLQNKYVMPGLINAHVHLFGSGKPMKALSGGNAQRRLLKFLGTNLGLKILDKIVAQNARTELYSGVTTVRSVGDFYYSDVRLRDNIEAGKILGPRLIVSGPAIAVTGGHGYGSFAVTSDSPWEGRKCVRKNIYEQVDFIKICVTGGVTDVAAHIESKEGIRTALKGGVDTIEHGSCLDDEIIGLFKNNPSSLRGYSALITTISPALPLYGLPASVTKLNKVSTQNSKIILEGMLAGTKQALEAGIKVGLGTDASCPFVTQYNTWRELEYIIKYVGVRPQRAIYNATYGNAEILGIDKETGTIEEGKSADILVLDANPYESIRVLSQPKMIFARGDIIDNPRIEKISTIDDVIDKIKL